jgi:hypothetical protein
MSDALDKFTGSGLGESGLACAWFVVLACDCPSVAASFEFVGFGEPCVGPCIVLIYFPFIISVLFIGRVLF